VDPAVDGDPDLYLEDWTAAQSAGILAHWFGTGAGQLGFDQGNFLYWSMDNEPEIWSGTHDDVMPDQCSGPEFMAKYFAVAKAARDARPGLKLTGPVTCNEWQWYSYNGPEQGQVDGMPWLEYFISAIAEEEIASPGYKLLDMVDIHFYPGESNPDQILQLHRVYFDETYAYPGANGVKTVNGGWDNNQTKEYILKRARAWLAEHGLTGVGVGVTETDVATNDPNILAVWYASCLGEFMANGGEVFAPWSWKTGMWETLHLFARYARPSYVSVPLTGSGAADGMVSAYGTVDPDTGNMTIFLVNRSRTQARPVSLAFAAGAFPDGDYDALSLSDLPADETFTSHAVNALDSSTVSLSDDAASLNLPPLSVTALILE
jgi:hypothetical protein